LGLAAGAVWTRAPGKVTSHRQRDIEDRESWRWIELGQAAKAALGGAAHVTLLADRESDIYEEWALLPTCNEPTCNEPTCNKDGPRFDLLTRACQDRKLACGAMMFSTARSWDAAACYSFDILARKGRPARAARMELRFGTVSIAKPKKCKTRGMPNTVELQLVEVVEIGAPEGPGVRGQEPVLWRLLTTQPVTSVAQALDVVELYQQRWRIEEYNRTLKKSGIDLEGAMVEGVHALQNLVAMGAVAGVAVMQLVEGRDAGPERRASEVIDGAEEAFAACLCPTLEGKTRKQKNPNETGSLAWVSWIVARLGGWSGYTTYGAAGPKTMAHGWQKFKAMAQGWQLRKDV
jgi:Transposase DDE domain